MSQNNRPTLCSLPSGGDLLVLVCLQDGLARLARADAHGVLHRQQEDLPVADGTGPGVAQDRVRHERHVRVLHHALDLELRAQVDRDLRAAVVLGDALLPAGSLHLGDGEARQAGVEQSLADRLERLVPDVGDDHLHAVTPSVAVMGVTGAGAGTGTPRARSATGPVEPAPISGAGMNCSGYPYIPCSAMSSPASSSASVTRRPIVFLIAQNVP